MKPNKTITFFIFLCSRHGRRCFKAQAEGLRLSMRSILLSILIAGTLLVCSTCDDQSPAPVTCDCLAAYGTTAHLGIDETCCNGTDCNCTQQTDTSVGGIPIRKAAGITVAQMNAAVAIISGAYTAGFTPNQQTVIAAKVTGIRIVSGSAVTDNGDGTVSVGIEADMQSVKIVLQDILFFS